jgi:hypothetical protein
LIEGAKAPEEEGRRSYEPGLQVADEGDILLGL